MLDRDAAMFRQAVAGTVDLDINVPDDKRRGRVRVRGDGPGRCRPEAHGRSRTGPYADSDAAEVRELIERLTWTVNTATEVNAQLGDAPEALDRAQPGQAVAPPRSLALEAIQEESGNAPERFGETIQTTRKQPQTDCPR